MVFGTFLCCFLNTSKKKTFASLVSALEGTRSYWFNPYPANVENMVSS